MIAKLFKLIRDEKGQVLIMVAAGMIVFLGVAALSIDYGYLAWQKRQLQNTVDAAALAAAWELPNGNYEARADEYIGKYIDVDEMPTTVTTTKLDGKTVRVEIDREYDLMLARILGIDTSDIYAMADAQKDSWYTGLLPFALRDDYIEDDDDPNTAISSLTEYVQFMENKIPDKDDNDESFRINLWGKEDDENLKFGLVKLGEFSDPYKINTSPKDVIEAGLDKSIYGEDLQIGTGLDSSIANSLEGKNNPKPDDYPGFLNLSNGEGYIIGVLPSRAVLLENSTNNNIVYWEEYVILHFTNLEYDKNGKVYLSGILRNVYNISDPDFSEEEFQEDFFIGRSSKLVK